jgi:hypothetical protein
MYCSNIECPDFVATGMYGEYREGITVCPYCAKPLVEEKPGRGAEFDDRRPESPRHDSWGESSPPEDDAEFNVLEPIFETFDPTEVPVVRSFLDSEGIPHVVVGEERFDAFRGSLSPFRINPRAGSVVFLVPPTYSEIARELLADIEGESEPDR